MIQHTRATLAGLAAIGLWASLAVMTSVTDGIPPFQLLAITFAIGGALGLSLLARRGGVQAALRQPLPAFALSTAALFSYHFLYFVALRGAPIVEANLVNYLWPLLIVVFAALSPGVQIRPGQILGTLLGLAGAVLVVTRLQPLALAPEHLAGYAAALGAAVTWAAYSVLNRRFAVVPSAAIVGPCLATAALAGATHLLLEATVAPSPAQWLAMLAMGLGPVGAAFWFWDIGTKRGDLGLLGTFSYATPLLSTALLLVVGRASPHWTQAVALALLLLGGTLGVGASRSARKPA